MAMIYWNVTGGTKREKYLVREAFEFAVSDLMPRKKNLDVEFFIRKLDGDVHGYHQYIDNGEHNIEIRKGLDEEDFITAVFHEMVHVRQSERRQMKDKGFVKVWNGVEYLSLYSTVDEYMSLPWEAEAYQLQEEMLERWNQKTKCTGERC
jgi:hypothetical protein